MLRPFAPAPARPRRHPPDARRSAASGVPAAAASGAASVPTPMASHGLDEGEPGRRAIEGQPVRQPALAQPRAAGQASRRCPRQARLAEHPARPAFFAPVDHDPPRRSRLRPPPCSGRRRNRRSRSGSNSITLMMTRSLVRGFRPRPDLDWLTCRVVLASLSSRHVVWQGEASRGRSPRSKNELIIEPLTSLVTATWRASTSRTGSEVASGGRRPPPFPRGRG